MSNEKLVRQLIKGSLQRAIQETIAAILVIVAFATMLHHSEPGAPRYYGCLLVLISTGAIIGVVWSYAFTYQALRLHPASDTTFWRDAFQAQARLLRLVPYWYCAPLGMGGLLSGAPTESYDLIPFAMVAGSFAVVIAGVIWLNRRAAASLEQRAQLLAD